MRFQSIFSTWDDFKPIFPVGRALIKANRSIKVEHSAKVRKVVGSIPDRVIPKISKMVLDASLLIARQLREGLANFPTYLPT